MRIEAQERAKSRDNLFVSCVIISAVASVALVWLDIDFRIMMTLFLMLLCMIVSQIYLMVHKAITKIENIQFIQINADIADLSEELR